DLTDTSNEEAERNTTESVVSSVTDVQEREGYVEFPLSVNRNDFDIDRKGLFFNFYRPPPRYRPLPHRPPPHPPTFRPPAPHPPVQHPPGRRPQGHNPSPPHNPDFPDFGFDFDPPNFFEPSDFSFPDEESFSFEPSLEDEEFFKDPHTFDNDFNSFPSHLKPHSSPHSSPHPSPHPQPHLQPFESFSPDFDAHPVTHGPNPSSILPFNINHITEDSIYRDDVPVKEVHNERDKIHPGLDHAGIKGLKPDFLSFLEEQTKSYINTESSVDFD
ncbi:uncharacterized protein, partial [Cherax quadricarinatus]